MTLKTLQTPLALVSILALGCSAQDNPESGDGSAGTTDAASSEGSSSAATQDGTSTGMETTEADGSSSGSPETTGGPTDDANQDFIDRLPGLWVAPVTSWTSVGSFPTMNMDIRREGETMFARVDLDADNSLRFGFALEEHEGAPVLVYRNGGQFLGIDRDTRTELVEFDEDAQSWRFCAIAGGCGYVDATFEFDGDTAFTLDVKVMGMDHILWEAVRREERPITDGLTLGDPLPGDAPFPDIPSLEVELSWSDPLAEAADAWIILSTTDCGFTAACVPSRFHRVSAPAGATSAMLVLEQIHPGEYSANAMLDRNGNLAGTLFPDAGDTVAFPDQGVTVNPTGTSTAELFLSTDL